MELLHHGASAEAPLICLVDSPDHPFQLGELPAGFDAAVARFERGAHAVGCAGPLPW